MMQATPSGTALAVPGPGAPAPGSSDSADVLTGPSGWTSAGRGTESSPAPAPDERAAHSPTVDPLFFSVPRVSTLAGERGLTQASGFYFQRDGRLYLVTSRHVVFDQATRHVPDRLEIELHLDGTNLTRSTGFSIPLYVQGQAVWRQGRDGGGDIDVAVLEIERRKLPASVVIRAFTPAHLVSDFAEVPVGEPLVVVGFPLGFHDAVHHLPVLRYAMVASPYGIRFQGKGYFLTDARTHRGTSGAPVVSRRQQPNTEQQALPWRLLGVHSSRMDMGNRDLLQDESLGLNCVWYADILLRLTADPSRFGPG